MIGEKEGEIAKNLTIFKVRVATQILISTCWTENAYIATFTDDPRRDQNMMSERSEFFRTEQVNNNKRMQSLSKRTNGVRVHGGK